jgi:hypothetical protein
MTTDALIIEDARDFLGIRVREEPDPSRAGRGSDADAHGICVYRTHDVQPTAGQ